MKKKITIFLVIILIIISIIFIFYKFFIMDEDTTSDQTGQSTNEEDTVDNTPVFFVQSPVFEDEGRIPDKYCDKGVTGGENISVPIEWKNLPEGTKSLFIVIVDTHPVANNWLHWVVSNIPSSSGNIPEAASGTDKMPSGSIELSTTSGQNGYDGPEPPAGSGDHPYEIHLFALSQDEVKNIPAKPTWEQIQSALKSITLKEVQYTGYFGR